MLTQNDLRQIELIVDRVVEKKLIPIRIEIEEMKKDIRVMQKDIRIIQEEIILINKNVRELQQEVKVIKRDTREMRISINILADHFDVESHETKSRIERLENHLKLPPN